MGSEIAKEFVGKEFTDSELLTNFLAVIKRKFKTCEIRELSHLKKDKVYFFIASQTKDDVVMISVDITVEDGDVIYMVTKVNNI